MDLTGSEDHGIDLDTAAEWTANYRNSVSAGSIIAEAFGKNAISQLIGQENCVGVRIYYALNDLGEKRLILVGVNSSGNDLYEGDLVERGFLCPQDCSAANPLNSN